MKPAKVILFITAVMLCISLSSAAFGVQAAQSNAVYPALSSNTNIIKYVPHMTTQSLAGRPDSDVIEFSNGKTMTVGRLRQWEAFAAKLRAPRVDKTPAAFKVRPNPGNIKMNLNNLSDLASAIKLSNDATVKLPSGKVTTVGIIKLFQPYIEKKLGRKLSEVQIRPNLSGPAIQVSKATPVSEWKNISKMSDNTVLEFSNGFRFTIGELRQKLAQYKLSHNLQMKTVPQKIQGQKRRLK